MILIKRLNAISESDYHHRVLAFLRREIVFVIAFAAAVVTAFFNPPSLEWIAGIDFRTIALLFSLMGVSEGLKASGLFDYAGSAMLKKSGNTRTLSLLLLLIVFISSMFFTNDVVLLMFVPFTLLIMDREGEDEGYIIKLVVLETIAANLGSMTTPVGNPQNIYICSFFDVEAQQFFRTILPYSAISAVMIAFAFAFFLSKKRAIEGNAGEIMDFDRKRTVTYLLFLALAMLSVFHVVPWQALFALEALFLIAFDRKILLSIDYILLLTFVCFFIFSANIREIEAVNALLSTPMKTSPVAVSAIVSQVISNVPAAILLSGFADGFEGVLVGTDIGGLGTPVASLASLISLKFYFKRKEGRKGQYILVFLALNAVMLLILFLFSTFLTD